MEPIEYLRIIRRRWPVVVVLMLLGLVIGYATARPASAATSHSAASYQATAILGIPSGTADPSGLSLDTMAFFATSGRVPDMTAKALGDRSGGRDIVSHVQVTTQDTLSLLEISASEPTARRSAEVANGLSGQLITFLTTSCSRPLTTISRQTAPSSTDSPRSSRDCKRSPPPRSSKARSPRLKVSTPSSTSPTSSSYCPGPSAPVCMSSPPPRRARPALWHGARAQVT